MTELRIDWRRFHDIRDAKRADPELAAYIAERTATDREACLSASDAHARAVIAAAEEYEREEMDDGTYQDTDI